MNLRNIFRKSEAVLLSLCLIFQLSASCIVASAEGMTDLEETEVETLMETAAAEHDETEFAAFPEEEQETGNTAETPALALSEVDATFQSETTDATLEESKTERQAEMETTTLAETEAVDQVEDIATVSEETTTISQSEDEATASEETEGITLTETQSFYVNSSSESDYTYIVSDNKAEITGYTGTDTELVLPTTLGGYPVTSIGRSAFEDNATLKSVTIPEGYTLIDAFAFCDCRSLAEVSLPSTLTRIGCSSFNGCKNLSSIVLPEALEIIDDTAFYDTGLMSVTFLGSHTKISSEFALGWYYDEKTKTDFHSVPGFNINGPENSTAYQYAFEHDFLFNGESTEGFLYYKNYDGDSVYIYGYRGTATELVIPSTLDGYPVTMIRRMYAPATLRSITLPDTVVEIGWCAFWGSRIESITLPDSLTKIGGCAFVNTNLSEVTIPEGLSQIDAYAFGYHFPGTESDCFFDDSDALEYIEADHTFNIIGTVDTLAENYAIENDMLFNGARTSGYSYSLHTNYEGESYYSITGYTGEGGDIELPATHKGIPVWLISSQAFLNRTDITSITIPEGFIGISELAFYGCKNLTSVSLPSSMELIGTLAFGNCPRLESVNIPENTEVWAYAFGYSSEDEKLFHDEEGLIFPLLTRNPVFTIYGIPHTDAERYAKQYKLTFIALSADKPAAVSDSAGKIDSPATGDGVPCLLWSYLAMLFLSLSGIYLCARHLKHNN